MGLNWSSQTSPLSIGSKRIAHVGDNVVLYRRVQPCDRPGNGCRERKRRVRLCIAKNRGALSGAIQ